MRGIKNMEKISKVFDYEGTQVRTVFENGEFWFVVRDITDILSLDASQTRRLEDDEKGLCLIQTPGGIQEMTCVNEAGLYNLVLGSRKPEAKAFKRWITHEVIPSIRKTGSYSRPMSLEDLIILQAQSVKELKAKVETIEQTAVAAHHRIDNMDRIEVLGDLKQRFNAMIRRYAAQTGRTFQQGYRDFRSAYNNAFHTNITMLHENYKMKHGLKNLTLPEYLLQTGNIEDAIRVADKMLNMVAV